MTATAQKIEQAFKDLPPQEQAELFAQLETILYGEEEANRVAFERGKEMEAGTVKPLSEAEAWRGVRRPTE